MYGTRKEGSAAESQYGGDSGIETCYHGIGATMNRTVPQIIKNRDQLVLVDLYLSFQLGEPNRVEVEQVTG